MAGTQRDAMTFALMAYIYAGEAKKVQHDGVAQLAMYAFFDAMERMAIAVCHVLDGNGTPREEYENLLGYADRLSDYLAELDGKGDGQERGENG